MNDKLKPCPFCGSPAETESRGRNSWIVYCMSYGCGITLPEESYFTSEENAIKAWNTRYGIRLLSTKSD